MKYLKKFENFEDNPQIGDYVICGDPGVDKENHLEMYNFITNNIGQITKIDDKKRISSLYYIHYNNIPDNLKFWNQRQRSKTSDDYILDQEPFRRKNITIWAKTIEELKLKLSAFKRRNRNLLNEN